MAQPTKKQLLAAVCQLQGVMQEMFGAYANDVAPGRAERMQTLLRRGDAIAQPLIDAFPYEAIEAAMLSERDG